MSQNAGTTTRAASSQRAAHSRKNGPPEWAIHDPLQARRAKGFERLQIANGRSGRRSREIEATTDPLDLGEGTVPPVVSE